LVTGRYLFLISNLLISSCLAYKDEEAREEIKKVMVGFNLVEIKSLPKEQRDEMLSRIKKIEGITQRQVARILGISPNLIFKS
jgi:hypothetical protein